MQMFIYFIYPQVTLKHATFLHW